MPIWMNWPPVVNHFGGQFGQDDPFPAIHSVSFLPFRPSKHG